MSNNDKVDLRDQNMGNILDILPELLLHAGVIALGANQNGKAKYESTQSHTRSFLEDSLE